MGAVLVGFGFLMGAVLVGLLVELGSFAKFSGWRLQIC